MSGFIKQSPGHYASARAKRLICKRLGLTPSGLTPEIVNEAFRERVKGLHPDMNGGAHETCGDLGSLTADKNALLKLLEDD